uniref:starch synthase n=1 Tax=Kalanchoe fedtschenkoi TaxID=63787 RepID=A0A7N0T3V2_KALFE
MTTQLSTCFLNYGLGDLNCNRCSNMRLIVAYPRLFPAYCKMRQRSSQQKRAKKVYPENPPQNGNIMMNVVDDSGLDNDKPGTDSARQESVADASLGTSAHQFGSVDLASEPPLQEMDSPVVNENPEVIQHYTSMELTTSGGQLSSIQVEDLIGMIRNAEKNILLLNQARVRALEDLGKILREKEGLQGEINALEMRLAETDAKIRVAAQEKVRVELLEDELERLRGELSSRGGDEINQLDMFEIRDKALNDGDSIDGGLNSLKEELELLRVENVSLKDDVQSLKLELDGVIRTDERVVMLEKERSTLETGLRDLQSKVAVSQEDVSELSSLKFECQDLAQKVENLQELLDKATKQADQAVVVLQQNHELRTKVDKLEESLNEASIYKLSSDKIHQYNELLQQQIKLLEERLERSDEEIHSYVALYQESVTQFQDTLSALKEESKKRALDEPVTNMPWDFWSRLLLLIDGWLLEKKIEAEDAQLLREMAWQRKVRIRDAFLESRGRNERDVLDTFLSLTSAPKRAGLHIVHIAAEMAPVAKVGGLGDVVTGLGKALQKKGHLVEVVLPKYDCMQQDRVRDLRVLDAAVESYFNGRLYKNKIWAGTVEGLPVYFIEPQHPDRLFLRGQFYGENDDFKRFSYFSRAALELLLQAGKKPDIIHCHDWQTAFVAPLYWDLYAPKGLNTARICFTCHNFEYQGAAPASDLAHCGLDVSQLNRPDRMQHNSSHDRINPVKGGVVFSNIVSTVSPTYAQEVRSAELGQGLHGTLNSHSRKFVGILNGIDTDVWNPATDNALQVQYNSKDLQGKAENKGALRRQLGLSSANARQPLVGCITRLVPQKGVHLIRHAIYRTLELGGQFVLLGSSPVPHIQREFEGIANNFQNHDHIRLILKYDESLSHSIYAASDMFIIPSIFEPCGLTQMIAMRYGSIPVVRKTGGLNDSVFDVDDETIPLQFRNGYTFDDPDERGLNGALDRAFRLYNTDQERWQQLVQKVMSMDFSWDTSASQYEELYQKSVSRAKAANRS